MAFFSKRTARRALFAATIVAILLVFAVWAAGAILFPSGPPKIEQAQLQAMADAFGGEPHVGPQRYEEWKRTSFYLPMRDGVDIAVDLWLPGPLEPGDRLPAVIFPTRYWRRWDTRFIDWGERPWAMDRLLLSHGYAVVKVDARGSGASFGTRKYPWSPDEIVDYAQLVDWLVAQPWSNGRVGADGVSYSGTASEFLAALDHPAVRAAAVEFSLFDVYRDIAFPGGVFNEWFVSQWGRFNAALDSGTVPAVIGAIGKALVRGPAPADLRWTGAGFQPLPDDGREALQQAIEDHAANVDIEDAARRVAFRDQIAGPAGASTDDFSPSVFHRRAGESRTAILSVGGWYDGAYARSALQRFMTVPSAHTCIVGAWNHGGRRNVDPFEPRDADASPSRTVQRLAVLRFFDYYLRDEGPEPPDGLSYQVMGSGAWQHADTWPPQGSTMHPYYLWAGQGLAPTPDESLDGFDAFTPDLTHGSGQNNRWRTQLGQSDVYYSGLTNGPGLLSYTSRPLDMPIRIAGDPALRLFVSADRADFAVFAYLEAVDQDGQRYYITEGRLRPDCRGDSVTPRFTSDAAEPVRPGRTIEMTVPLLPVAMQIPAGYRLRVTIAGADADEFARHPSHGPVTMAIHRSAVEQSALLLPVLAPRDVTADREDHE